MGNMCSQCSHKSEEPPKPVSCFERREKKKEVFSYKLAPIEELKKAKESVPDQTKTVIEVPNLLEKLRKLKCTGTITLERGSNFWMIILDDNWQDQKLQDELLNAISYDKACRDDFITQADRKAKKWASLLGLRTESKGFFSPTNTAGLHISLGVIKPDEKPDCVVEGQKVNFSIISFTTMPITRALPPIYPAQRTTSKGNITLMSCPTRYYWIDVNVEDFDFQFTYPPHVTLACYGLLKVPKAAVQEMHDSLEAAGYGSKYQYGKK